MIRIENPHYLASGLSFGTSRRADEGIYEGLGKVYTESSEVVFDAIDDKKK